MATVSSIISEVNRQTGGTYDTAKFLDWINACLSDLADIVYLPTTLDLTAAPDGSFILPDNFKSDLKVLPSGDKSFMDHVAYDELVAQGYAFYNNIIYIRNRVGITSVRVMYNRQPAPVTNDPNQVPDIPLMYHNAIIEYCKAQAMLYEEDIEADERYGFYWREYQRLRAQAEQYFSGTRSSTNMTNTWKVVR